jgi:hypothetical protein
MALSAPEVAALARQAVDLLDPDVAIEVEPDSGDDPYRFGASSWMVWPLLDGDRAFGVYLDSTMTPATALARLVDALSEASESRRFWGVAFPACPGHAHEATVGADADVVVVTCPSTGAVITRIRPVP